MATQAPWLKALKAWLKGLETQPQRWCILINADPDAMGAAWALKRIMAHAAKSIDIARINEVTRPDNLAMIKQLQLKIKVWSPEMLSQYDNFAIVDSQPHHHPLFANIPFKAIIDHHPNARDDQQLVCQPDFADIRPDMGATCSMFTQYLRALRIRPSAHLATAMLLGIRTDTASFERSGGEADLDAYQWLSKHSDSLLVRRIVRSEYLKPWLPLFTKAINNLYDCPGGGAFSWLGKLDSADTLVAIADFFTHVHGMHWITVGGIVNDTVVVIFRGDGLRDIGRFADACFYDIGSAGGHRTLGRAEFPLAKVPESIRTLDFIMQRLRTRKARPLLKEKSTAIHTDD